MELEKTSDFIERHTVVKEDGSKGFNILDAFIELHARMKSNTGEIRNIHSALGDYGQAGIDFDKRLLELEGKKTIEVVSMNEAKQILKG